MIKLGIVMDPISSINIKKDTSFAMLLEAQRRGYEIHYMEMGDLSLRGGVTYARTRLLSVEQNYDKWYEFGSEQVIPLADLNVVLMRKDPPFDTEQTAEPARLQREAVHRLVRRPDARYAGHA